MTTTMPNLDNAAIKAAETLIKYHVSSAPVMPLPILKSLSGVLVVSFAEMAERLGMERETVVTAFGETNQDAVTVFRDGPRIRYIVTYNQRLPFYMLQRALARELGHIILGHDGTRPEDVRTAEAVTFARHFLCPRALIRSIQEKTVITEEMLGNITGCYHRCLAGMRQSPGANVPSELNRLIHDQFSDYVKNFIDCQPVLAGVDDSPKADFGTYMDNYIE